MKTRMWVLVCSSLLVAGVPGAGRLSAQEGPYLGQPAPGLEAQKFAPGIVSVPENWEQYPMWSPDGLEFYYGLSNAQWGGGPGWFYMHGNDGLWTDPVHIDGGTPTPDGVSPLLTQFGIGMGPAFSADGRRVYLMANQNVWMSERDENGWSQPRDLDLPIDPGIEMWWISVTNDGTIFLTLGREASSTYNLYRARPDENGRYPVLENMAGTIPYQNMFFHHPAPDESYLILSQWNAGGTFGGYDLYITFRDDQDNWTAPKNLGPAVNTAIDEMAAFVTADGKYLFYNTRASSVQNADIYWIETRAVLPDPNGPVHNPRTGERFGSIQCAIDWAEFGDEIVVTPGIYREGLHVPAKELLIRSSEPSGLTTDATVIQGDPSRPALDLAGRASLDSLTFTGGSIGVVCTAASALLTHCCIVENEDDGIQVSADTHLELYNCVVAANGGAGIHVLARPGRGMLYGRCTIANCTLAQNGAPGLVGEGGESTLTNSIVYFNGIEPDAAQIDGMPRSVTYCDIEGGFVGAGNIDADPLFVADGDYHLAPDSPCIDAGDPADDPGAEPAPNGGRINLGAYGGTAHATCATVGE